MFLIRCNFNNVYTSTQSFFELRNGQLNEEGLPGVLGNKDTLAKYRREQGNISQFLGTGNKISTNYSTKTFLRECGNMGT